MVGGDTRANPTAACVIAPGSLPGSNTPTGVGNRGLGSGGDAMALPFPATSIVKRPYGQVDVSADSCKFDQNPDGAFDSALDLMRFGLLTCDTDPNAGR